MSRNARKKIFLNRYNRSLQNFFSNMVRFIKNWVIGPGRNPYPISNRPDGYKSAPQNTKKENLPKLTSC